MPYLVIQHLEKLICGLMIDQCIVIPTSGCKTIYDSVSQGLTARRLLSIQKCYVSKLDPTLPTPQKLKIDMELVSCCCRSVVL